MIKQKSAHLYSKIAVWLLAVAIILGGVLLSNENVYAKDADGDVVIVIDPGHGGYDGGASSVIGDKESELNWRIAKYMKAELETYAGVKVYVTRANNEWNTNTGRGMFGINVNADFIIGVHNNSSSNAGTNGYVVYGSVQNGLADVTRSMGSNLTRYAKTTGLNLFDGGYMTRPATNDPSHDYYTFIDEGNRSGIPTVIIEHCFLSNQSDATFIHDEYSTQKLGVANATAVAEFYGLSKRTIADNQSISLERSYSAYFTPNNLKDGEIPSFVSSDSNVAYVRNDGLITAVNEGSATITYTYSDGTSGNVTVNVKPVRMVGIGAGINPTVYRDSASVAAIDTTKVIVKAIYSDGSARQIISEFAVGPIDSNYAGRQYIDVSAYGFGTKLMINLDASAEAGTYSSYLYQPVGDFSDVFTLPVIVSLSDAAGAPSTNPGFVTSIKYPENETTTAVQTTEAVTEATTAPSTESVTEVITEAVTTQAESAAETSSEVPSESQTQQATENVTEISAETSAEVATKDISEMTTSSSNNTAIDKGEKETTAKTTETTAKPEKSGIDWVLVVLVLIIIVLLIVLAIAVLSLINSSKKPKRRKKK